MDNVVEILRCASFYKVLGRKRAFPLHSILGSAGFAWFERTGYVFYVNPRARCEAQITRHMAEYGITPTFSDTPEDTVKTYAYTVYRTEKYLRTIGKDIPEDIRAALVKLGFRFVPKPGAYICKEKESVLTKEAKLRGIVLTIADWADAPKPKVKPKPKPTAAKKRSVLVKKNRADLVKRLKRRVRLLTKDVTTLRTARAAQERRVEVAKGKVAKLTHTVRLLNEEVTALRAHKPNGAVGKAISYLTAFHFGVDATKNAWKRNN